MKSLIFKLLQVAIVLVVGQIPLKKTTVGGEFVAFLQSTYLKMGDLKMVQQARDSLADFKKNKLEEPVRDIAAKDWESKLRRLGGPEEISREDSEAIKSLLEKE